MQSLRRQIKRGNAVLAFNAVSKKVDVFTRKNTNSKIWNYAVRNRMEASEDVYMDAVTMPLSQSDIANSNKRFIHKKLKKSKPARKRKEKV